MQINLLNFDVTHTYIEQDSDGATVSFCTNSGQMWTNTLNQNHTKIANAAHEDDDDDNNNNDNVSRNNKQTMQLKERARTHCYMYILFLLQNQIKIFNLQNI